eukprot:1766116-Rhodomonas_salina.3
MLLAGGYLVVLGGHGSRGTLWGYACARRCAARLLPWHGTELGYGPAIAWYKTRLCCHAIRSAELGYGPAIACVVLNWAMVLSGSLAHVYALRVGHPADGGGGGGGGGGERVWSWEEWQ